MMLESPIATAFPLPLRLHLSAENHTRTIRQIALFNWMPLFPVAMATVFAHCLALFCIQILTETPGPAGVLPW